LNRLSNRIEVREQESVEGNGEQGALARTAKPATTTYSPTTASSTANVVVLHDTPLAPAPQPFGKCATLLAVPQWRAGVTP
jgi:hypothetical protein